MSHFLQYFKLFHYYYVCYGDLLSVIFDVIILKQLQLTEDSDEIIFLIKVSSRKQGGR